MTEEPPKLRVNDGRERKIALNSPQVVVGSGSSCDIVVDDPKCSRRHCKLEQTSEGWVVTDLESRHGTMVNGSFANRFQLQDGDRIEIGDVEMAIESVGAAPSGPSRSSSSGRQGERRTASFRRTGSLRPYIVFFVIVLVAGWAGSYYFNQYRTQKRASRAAFWSASMLYEQGKFEESISKYNEVSEGAPDVYRIARKSIELAKKERQQRRMRTERKKTEQAFRELVNSTFDERSEKSEVKTSLASFGEHLNKLPEAARDSVWYTHYEDQLEYLEQTVLKQVKAKADVEGPRQQWRETKQQARSLRDNSKYGLAANRVLRFRFVYSGNELNSEINSELMRIKVNAETHLESRKRQIDEFVRSGETAEARRTVKELKDELYSYHNPLSSLYVEAVKKQMSVERKLDTTSDSS